MKPALDLEILVREAAMFSDMESQHAEPALYGITDGKAVGTYLEHKFIKYLVDRYELVQGNSALGIDLPELEVDIKVTSIKQPQSSCPFKSARQKIYGLGYHLIVFVYEKSDDAVGRTAVLHILHVIFVDRESTADYQMTRSILQILQNGGNTEDLVALMQDRNLPVDEIEANNIAEEILRNPPRQGYLTISNALQWRLQYTRVIQQAGIAQGLMKVR